MKRLFLALLISLLASLNPALAQNFTMPPPAGVTVVGFVVVSSCGGLTLTAGKPAFATMDTTGALCLSGGGSGTTTANQGTPNTVANGWPVKITDGTNTAAVSPANTAPTTAQPNLNVAINCSIPNAPCIPLGPAAVANSVPFTFSSQYPTNATTTVATPLAATSGNVAAAVATATLSSAAGKTTYITGFQIAGSGATIGTVVNCTVTNIVGSVTLNYPYAAIAGALLMNTPIIVNFNPAVPAIGPATSIVVSCPSLGTGNTNNTVNAFGYQL